MEIHLKTLLFIAVLVTGLCAGDYVSYMPKSAINLDSLIVLPVSPQEILSPGLHDFKTELIDSGMVCKKKFGLLVSEKKVAESLFYQYGYERLQKELRMTKYLLQVHDSISSAVEKNIYWKELAKKDTLIYRLELKVEKGNKPGFFEKNATVIGIVIGVALTVITSAIYPHVK